MENKNKRVNKLIACCFTPYHAIVAGYYARELRGLGIKTVMIWNSNSNGFDIDLVSNLFDDVITTNKIAASGIIKRQHIQIVEYGRMFSISHIAKEIRQSGNSSVLMVFSDQESLTAQVIDYYKENVNSSIILIDEGIGLYTINDNLTGNKDIMKKIKNMIYGVRTQNYIGENNDIKYIIAKNPELIPDIKKTHRTIIKQEEIRISITDLNINNSLKSDLTDVIKLVSKFNNVICYFGQPTYEIGIAEEFDIKNIETICRNIGKDTLLIIKPHPRDKINKYDKLNSKNNICTIGGELGKLPFELLSNLIKCNVFITTTSSICIQMVKESSKNIGVFTYKLAGNVFGSETEKIIKSLGSQAIIPNNSEELGCYISKIDKMVGLETTIENTNYTLPKINKQKNDVEAIINLMQ